MRRLLIIGLLLLGACTEPGKPASDLGAAGDLPGAPDLPASADLRGRDLAGADLGAGLDLVAAADLRMLPDFGPDYPPGPYGANEGDTLAPMVWEGYVNPSAAGLASDRPYVTYTSDDLRRSGARYALLYTADFF